MNEKQVEVFEQEISEQLIVTGNQVFFNERLIHEGDDAVQYAAEFKSDVLDLVEEVVKAE